MKSVRIDGGSGEYSRDTYNKSYTASSDEKNDGFVEEDENMGMEDLEGGFQAVFSKHGILEAQINGEIIWLARTYLKEFYKTLSLDRWRMEDSQESEGMQTESEMQCIKDEIASIYIELAKKDIAIAEIENNLDAALRQLEEHEPTGNGSGQVDEWTYLMENQVENPSPSKVRSPKACVSPVSPHPGMPSLLRLGSTSQSHCDGTPDEGSCLPEEGEDSPSYKNKSAEWDAEQTGQQQHDAEINTYIAPKPVNNLLNSDAPSEKFSCSANDLDQDGSPSTNSDVPVKVNSQENPESEAESESGSVWPHEKFEHFQLMYHGLRPYITDESDADKLLEILALIPNATLQIMESKLRMETAKLASSPDADTNPKYINIIA